jgi:hypothetical protein
VNRIEIWSLTSLTLSSPVRGLFLRVCCVVVELCILDKSLCGLCVNPHLAGPVADEPIDELKSISNRTWYEVIVQ